jgi:hypothetical protein
MDRKSKPLYAVAWVANAVRPEAAARSVDHDRQLDNYVPSSWDEEREWVRHVWSGKTLASSELERWLAAIGTGISEV